MLTWPARRWIAGLLVGAATYLLLGGSAGDAVIVTSVLFGLFCATYVPSRQPSDPPTARLGVLGAALAAVAVPIVPAAAVPGLALLAWALVRRLRGEAALCLLPPPHHEESRV